MIVVHICEYESKENNLHHGVGRKLHIKYAINNIV